MEKNTSLIQKILVFTAACLLPVLVYAERPEEKVSFRIWALVDAIPSVNESAAEGNSFYSRAVEDIKKNAPYTAAAAVHGWRFLYTPSDKARGVKEYFECELIAGIDPRDKKLRFRDPFYESGRLFCRVEYLLDDYGKIKRREQQSLSYKKIHGTGSAGIIEGPEGFESAMKDAVKNAVREYARSIEKNKPKEISGSVTLAGDPCLNLRNGKYLVELDFFLYVGKIIQYTVF